MQRWLAFAGGHMARHSQGRGAEGRGPHASRSRVAMICLSRSESWGGTRRRDNLDGSWCIPEVSIPTDYVSGDGPSDAALVAMFVSSRNSTGGPAESIARPERSSRMRVGCKSTQPIYLRNDDRHNGLAIILDPNPSLRGDHVSPPRFSTPPELRPGAPLEYQLIASR
jgi:hypothetical protein